MGYFEAKSPRTVSIITLYKNDGFEAVFGRFLLTWEIRRLFLGEGGYPNITAGTIQPAYQRPSVSTFLRVLFLTKASKKHHFLYR